MQAQMYRGIRKRSVRTLCGLPLFDIAMGPDPAKGEMRGYAHGIIAVGDVARGWIAIGGMALGGIAVGGVAAGIVSIGGLSFGVLALGGTAIGGVAIGGFAAGYYALGGGAEGKYVVSAMKRSPEALEFFKHWFPFLPLQ